MKKSHKPIPFQQVVKTLLDDEKPFPARYLYLLSDISPQDLAVLKQTWPKISLHRRQALMEDIHEFNEDDFMLNFFEVGQLAVQDPDTQVRLLALLTLAAYEGEDLVTLFIKAAESDPEMEVRAAATAALGGMVQQGELDELPAESLKQVENSLLRILDGQDAKKVRQSALESLGYSSLEQVGDLIKNAYQSGDSEWITSSLVAMGRSYDEMWKPDVLAMLKDTQAAIRQEAVRAAGELEIAEAAPILKELLLDEEDLVRQASIWSLSQIGGPDVRALFERMLEAADHEDEIDLLETALENLEFTEGFPNLSLFDLDEEDEEGEFDED
jgi:HEAT repeat protein